MNKRLFTALLCSILSSVCLAVNSKKDPTGGACGKTFDTDETLSSLVNELAQPDGFSKGDKRLKLENSIISDPHSAKLTATLIISRITDVETARGSLNLANLLVLNKRFEKDAYRAFVETLEPTLRYLVNGDFCQRTKQVALRVLSNIPDYAPMYQNTALELAKADKDYTHFALRCLGHGGPANASYLPWIDQLIQTSRMSMSDESLDSIDAREAIKAFVKIASNDDSRAKIIQIMLTHPKAAMRFEAVQFVSTLEDASPYKEALMRAVSDEGVRNFNVGQEASKILEKMGHVKSIEEKSAGIVDAAQKKKSARKFVEISTVDLSARIDSVIRRTNKDMNALPYLTNEISRDLSKVKFNTGSVFIEEMSFPDEVPYKDSPMLLGYNKLSNGLSFLGAAVWGEEDGIPPVFFIIYWDGRALRGYIPKEGNMWNTDTKQAFGFNGEADLINIKKNFPENEDLTKIDYYQDVVGLQFDKNALEQDILSRFEKITK